MAGRWVIVMLVWLLHASNVLLQAVSHYDYYKHLEHPDLSNVLKYPSCAEFLLKEESQVKEASKTGLDSVHGWGRGLWFPTPEAFDPDLKPPGKWMQESPFRCDAEQRASFGVNLSGKWGYWKPSSVSTKGLHAVSGTLSLTSFWDRLTEEGPQSSCQMDDLTVDALIVLQGASIVTESDKRLCMLGCSARPRLNLPSNGHSFVKDCSIMVKAKYPKLFNILSRHVEAELTSLRAVEDPMYFPPVTIYGPDFGAELYQFAQVGTLEPVLNNSFIGAADNVSLSSYQAEHLAKHLERTNFTTFRSPTAKEQQMLFANQKVRIGPFTTQLSNDPNELSHGNCVTGIRASIRFRNIICRPSSGRGTGLMLVSGLMLADIYVYHQLHPHIRNLEQQKPSNVEGMWNPTSGELCMVGCKPENFSSKPSFKVDLLPDKTPDSKSVSSCTWKVCLHSVLSKSVTINSPRGAILSSLHEAGQPDFFESLTFTPPTNDFEEHEFNSTLLNSYKYTNVSRAFELGMKNKEDGAIGLIGTEGLVFPAPTEGDLCSSISLLESYMQMDQLKARKSDGNAYTHVLSLLVTNFESCRHPWRGNPWDNSLTFKSYAPDTYFKVALKFDIWKIERLENVWALYPHRAEGVYQPYTGQMHLVANLLLEDGGDPEVYIKIQYPPVNPTSHGQKKVNFIMKSLRSPSDLLYFAPLELEVIPKWLPSVKSIRRNGVAVSKVKMLLNASQVTEAPSELEVIQSQFSKIKGDRRNGVAVPKVKMPLNVLQVTKVMRKVELLEQTILMFCAIQQIMYSRKSKDVLPFVSQTMLGFHALRQLAQSLTFSSSLGPNEISHLHPLDSLVNALALVVALLLLIFLIQVHKARTELNMSVFFKSKTSNANSYFLSELISFVLSLFVFSLILVFTVLSSQFKLFAFTALHNYGIGHNDPRLILEIPRFAFKLVQDLYLVPQVIANFMCDINGSPLTTSFVLIPSLLHSIQYFCHNPRLIRRLRRAFLNSSFPHRLLFVNGTAPALVVVLAIIVLMQQRWGGRGRKVPILGRYLERFRGKSHDLSP